MQKARRRAPAVHPVRSRAWLRDQERLSAWFKHQRHQQRRQDQLLYLLHAQAPKTNRPLAQLVAAGPPTQCADQLNQLGFYTITGLRWDMRAVLRVRALLPLYQDMIAELERQRIERETLVDLM